MSFDLDLTEMSLFEDLQESVDIERYHAVERNRRDRIVSGLACALQPMTSIDRQRHALEVTRGVPVGQQEMYAILPRDTQSERIQKGDVLIRGDGSELRVESLLRFPGTRVMELGLRGIGVV